MELLVDREHLKYYNQDLFAKSAVETIYQSTLENDAFRKLFLQKDHLQRQGNVVVNNAVDYFLRNLSSSTIETDARAKKSEILSKLTSMNSGVANVGSKKINEGAKIFVHSINNQITQILEKAAKTSKFQVNLVEHAPMNLGAHLTRKLCSTIKLNLYPDMSVAQAVKNSEICFIGADALTKGSGAVVKTGTNLVLDLCKNYHIPTYLCAHSWKYDTKGASESLLMARHDKEPYINSSLFEELEKSKIGAYIIEHGIFSPETIEREIRSINGWMR